MGRVFEILILIFLAASFASVARAQMYATAGNQQYSVTDIGVLSSQFPYCAPTAINSCGQVAGNSNVSPSDANHGFYYAGNGATLVDLGALGAGGPYTQSVAYGLNNASVVVGVSNNEGFVWTPQNGMQGVGFLTGGTDSELESINDANVAVGAAIPAGATVSHAAIWDPTNGLRDLNTLIVNPPATWAPTVAVAISQNGIIAGLGSASSGSSQNGFVLDGGTLTAIPNPGAFIQPEGINSSAETVGFYFDAGQHEHAFVYTPALGTRDIGTLGLSVTGSLRPYASASGVNDLGVVVGTDGWADGSEHAFLWTDAGGMINIESPTNVVFDGADGINSSGQVIIQGYYANDTALGYRGFVLTPTPEPNSMALLAVSAATIVMARFRQIRGKSFVRSKTKNPIEE